MTHNQALKAAEMEGRASADNADAVNPYHMGREPAYHQAWLIGRMQTIAAARGQTARIVGAGGNRWVTTFH